ncbi:MAG: rhodanese-like domain-containing protein [Pirellulales bacterium]|nr:rhodanese-like domain-containing protein [Pirellulales bacterium]
MAVGGAAASLAADLEHTKESLEAVKAKVAEKKAVLVDVRDKEEWNKGHIDGAIFLPLSEFRLRNKTAEMTKNLPGDRVLYTYCVVGMRSLKAAELLKKQGYEVRALKPGYEDLLKAGFPNASK